MRFRQYKIRTGRGQPVLVHVDVLSTVSDVITSLGMSERSLEELTYSLTFAWNEPIPLSMRMDMLLPNIVRCLRHASRCKPRGWKDADAAAAAAAAAATAAAHRC